MSTCLNKEIRCPSCGVAENTKLWPGIPGGEEPELREKVLDESLFCWKCPECGYEMQLVYPCLYHDHENGFVIFLEPNPKEPSFHKYDVDIPSGTKKRIVARVEELKEKVLIFEAGLNDAAVELAKIAVLKVIENRKQMVPQQAYFCRADEEIDLIEFVFYFEEEAEPLYEKTRFELYRQTKTMVDDLKFKSDSKDFLSVNLETAQLMLEAVQSRGK